MLALFLSHTHIFWSEKLYWLHMSFPWTAVCCCVSFARVGWSQTIIWHESSPPYNHVWIYLSKSEFISCSLPLVFLLDILSPVLSEIARSFTLDYGLKAVHCFAHPRPKLPGAFCDASWHGLVWMCVIKPTQCCLRRLEVKVVSPLIL